MASTTGRSPSPSDRLPRPRPRKPDNTLRPNGHSSNGHIEVPPSGVSSGRSTPVPHDAPPSAQSISAARKEARAQARNRIFHSINYTPRLSHFDPQSEYTDFRGFFVLFWIGLAFMVVTTALRNIKETGYPLRVGVYRILAENILSLSLSDAAMVGSAALSLPLQRLYRTNTIFQWRRGGSWIQSIFQALWLFLWVEWPFILDWTWTAQVFFVLHTLTFLMKMHSYAFYNGHLSEMERRLHDLDQATPQTPIDMSNVKYPTSPSRLTPLQPADISTPSDEKEDADSRHPMSPSSAARLHNFRASLATELTSPLGNITYPQNLTLANYVDYTLCPTLCYELEYPRTPSRSYLQLFYKTLAVFGCIFLMTIISEESMTPVLTNAAIRLHPLPRISSDRFLILGETISLLLFPFMIIFLLVFLVIWEYLLNAFAEVTCFADRHFYSDWWNSADWLEFSRKWNIPVYHFLRRHVYFSSRTYFSDSIAMTITFLVSALGHELIMGCITKKLRGYGMVAMMMQLPIVMVQRSKPFRDKWVLNNAAFWGSIILGLALLCSLYVLL